MTRPEQNAAANLSQSWRDALAAAATVFLLASCAGQQNPSSTSTATGTGTSTATTTSTATSTSTSTATSTSTDTAASTSTSTATDTSSTVTSTATSTAATDTASTSTPATNTAVAEAPKTAAPAGAPQQSVNLETMPNNTPICLVAGNTITVGEFKRMLRLQQIQVSASMSANPMVKAQMLQLAKQKNIALTADEKAKVMEAALQGKGDVKEFCKQNNLTEAKFKEEVENTALAFKISSMIIEQGLLNELVNRELMAQATKDSGGEKAAMDKYFRFKHSKQFTLLQQQTGLPEDALSEEAQKAELAKIQLEKLSKEVKVTDAEIKKLYDMNKEAFKHGEAIRIGRIVILCPEKDVGPMKSVRAQVENAKPELKGKDKELDEMTAKVMENQRQKALLLLGRAMGGEDFNKLANENSDDMTTKNAKNGGDMGWVEKKALVPQMGDVLWKLKQGEVLKQLVKDDVGYAIYKCTGKKAAGYASLAEAKPLLTQKLKQDKLNVTLQNWINKRKSIVRIEFSPKFVAMAQAAAKNNNPKLPQ